MCNFALFDDDIIGVRGTWPSLHCEREIEREAITDGMNTQIYSILSILTAAKRIFIFPVTAGERSMIIIV